MRGTCRMAGVDKQTVLRLRNVPRAGRWATDPQPECEAAAEPKGNGYARQTRGDNGAIQRGFGARSVARRFSGL